MIDYTDIIGIRQGVVLYYFEKKGLSFWQAMVVGVEFYFLGLWGKFLGE